MVATPTKPAKPDRRIGVTLFERLDLSAATVDKQACVIKHVKVLGPDSPNKHGMDVEGTDYLPSAHRQVKQLYEGMRVNVGHPPRTDPDAERHPNDRNGVLFNVQTENGNQTFADWKLIPSHPMTARLLECAADPQLHDQFALSHNAKGYGHVRENRYQVAEIPKVRSVDVVCDGGTNKSLFESQETTMKKPFKQLLESALPTTQERFKPLLEMYEDLGDMPADAPPPMPAETPAEEKPAMDYMGHLGEMVKAICADEGLSIEEKRDKIMAAIKVMEETKAPEGEVAEGEEGEAETPEGEECTPEEKKKKEKAAMESREKDAKELLQLRGEKQVRDLCESSEFIPSAIQVKAMIPLSESDRKAFIKEQKGFTAKVIGKGSNTPRTAAGRTANVTESRQQDFDYSDSSEEAMKKRAAARLS